MNDTTNNMMEWIKGSDLRKHLVTLIFVFIALFLITETVLTYKEAVHYKNPSDVNFITVTGKAEEYVKPDTLTFDITINEDGKDNAEATQKVADKTQKANAILKSNGVKDENIKLGYYNVQDKYETTGSTCSPGNPVASVNSKIMMYGVQPSYAPVCQPGNSKIVGQTVTQVINVKIPDIDTNANNETRSKIISQLSAENIKADGFSFTVFDVETLKREIRQEAIQDAQADAKKLAKDLGVKLEGVTSFSENGGGYPSYMMSAKVSDSSAENTAPSAPELSPGQQKITSNVTLTYSIR